MRVIEHKMIESLRSGRGFKRDNTAVVWYTGYAKVYLHGNQIAEYHPISGDLYLSDCGWQTSTTKSRLNAILRWRNMPCIWQKDFKWYRGDAKWYGNVLVNVISGELVNDPA